MKFGGTSVEDATAIDRIAGIVKGRLAQHPFVVVSAMSKVTDTLLAMAAAAGKGDRDKALDLCRQVRERHFNTAGELLGTGLFTELHSELQAEFDVAGATAARHLRGGRTHAADIRQCGVVRRTAVERRR